MVSCKVTQLLSGGAGIPNYAVWFQSLSVTTTFAALATLSFVNKGGQGRESGLCRTGRAWKHPDCDSSNSACLGRERAYL